MDKDKELWGLVNEALDAVNREYPQNGSVIHCRFLSREEIREDFPKYEGKAGFAILPPKGQKIELPGVPERADGLALFDRDLLAGYERDLQEYTVLHELLHCTLGDERNEVVHPLTLELLEKYFGISPKAFMAKYGHLYSEE